MQFTLTTIILVFKDRVCPRNWNLQITVLIDLLFFIFIQLLLIPPPRWPCQVVLIFNYLIPSLLLKHLLLLIVISLQSCTRRILFHS